MDKETFPSFDKIKEFIVSHQKATINEIKTYFKQSGEDIITISKPNCKNKKLVLAFNINGKFFEYLQEFMKNDFVLCDTDKMACLISDSELYTGPHEFLPITLSIKT